MSIEGAYFTIYTYATQLKGENTKITNKQERMLKKRWY